MTTPGTGPRVVTAPGTRPRVAVGPGPAPWAAEAIVRGGGEVVGLDKDPAGLVWTDGGAMDALRSALATRPKISWVQLPQAGVERAFQAGVVDLQRRWTSAKGAFAEPVAEHALALILAGLRQLKVRARAQTWGQPGRGEPVRSARHRHRRGRHRHRADAPARAVPHPVTVVRRHAEPVPGAARTLSTDR